MRWCSHSWLAYPLCCCQQDAHELFQVLLTSLDDELVGVCHFCGRPHWYPTLHP